MGYSSLQTHLLHAGVTQLVEYLLPKQDAAGSSPVARSNFPAAIFPLGALAKGLDAPPAP